MNEIIKIEKRNFNNEVKESVNARILYDYLGLNKAVISRWLDKNIINNNFAIEHEDWEGFNIYVEGNSIKDYVNLLKKFVCYQGQKKENKPETISYN